MDRQPDLKSEFLKENDPELLKSLNERIQKIEETTAARNTNFRNKVIDGRYNNIMNVSTSGGKKHLHINPNPLDTDHDIDIEVDEIVLCSWADDSVRHSCMKVSQFTTMVSTDNGNGVDKLDEGEVAADTWYYLWIIARHEVMYSADGDAISGVGGLISLSEDDPLMPGGYTFRCRVGVFRTDGDANIIWFHQTDNQWWLKDEVNFFANQSQVIFTARSLAGINPPHAQTVMLTFYLERLNAASVAYWKSDAVPPNAGGHAVAFVYNAASQMVWNSFLAQVDHHNDIYTRVSNAGARHHGYYNGCFLPI